MKPLLLETVLSLVGSVFMGLAIFHKPLRVSDDWEWPFLIAAGVCWILLLILQRRRRSAQLTTGSLAFEKPPARRRFWLLLLLVVAASLSSPLWLPSAGSTLPTSTLIITSIISCGLAILLFVFSWRYWNKKSNQALERSADRHENLS